MSESKPKRLKTDCNFNSIEIMFIKDNINSKRLNVLQNSALSNGFAVNSSFSESIDYIISDFEYEEQVIEAIGLDIKDFKAVVVNTKWFTDSVKAKQLMSLSLNTIYSLKRKNRKLNSNEPKNESKSVEYICQRKTPFLHFNHTLTDSLDVMAFEAELQKGLFDSVRYLAFKKASAVLKSLPFQVKHIDEVSHLKDIGKHSKKIIQEILDEGISSEVQTIENSVWFKTMKVFTNIYGIGPKTAQKWYDLGLRSLSDVMECKAVLKTQSMRVLNGIAFYEELIKPMTKSEANHIMVIIRKAIELKFGSDSTKIEMYLTGGFSRGKEFGHDIDILICHCEEGREEGLLNELYKQLKEMNLILLGNSSKSDNNNDIKSKSNTFDNFDKMFTLFKRPIDENKFELSASPSFDRDSTKALFDYSKSESRSEWKLCRVDLIVCPKSELCLALIGWTGNELFCRSLREYAKKEMNMRLSNHSLHDLSSGSDFRFQTEQEVFEALKLPFIEHHLRNP